MAEVFLKSLRITNNGHFRVLLSTRNLNDTQINRLKSFYPGVEIENKFLNFEDLAVQACTTVECLKGFKKEVEEEHVNMKNKVWKLMIAAEDRPKALFDLLLRGNNGVATPIMHFDIDTLFRKSIWPLIFAAMKHDCCLLLRENFRPIKGRITISTMAWRRNERTIDLAFKDLRDNINYHKLSKEWGYPGLNKKSNYVWSGAIHKCMKKECIQLFEEQLGELK
jgi:hypothetical protein